MIELLRGQRNPLRMSVAGDWGSGKSLFLRRLCATLEGLGSKVCYVDVSQSDWRSRTTACREAYRWDSGAWDSSDT